ncbi:beta-propeller fold lactonase family protein [Streptomyces griseoviridis]
MPAQHTGASDQAPDADGTPVALCVDWANDTVTVVDTGSPQTQPLPVTSAATGTNPRAIAVGSDTTRVYVPAWETAELAVFTRENATVTPLTTVAVRNNPCAVLAGLAHGRICVANRGHDSVTVLAADGADPVHLPLAPGSLPHALAASPDGTRVLVAGWGSGSLFLVDVSGAGSPLVLGTPLQAGGRPRVLAAHPTLAVGYAAVWGAGEGGESGAVYAIDLSGDRPTTLGPEAKAGRQPRAMTVTADGTHLYVANFGSGSVDVLPLHPGTGALTGASRTAEVGPNPVALTALPGTTVCYAVSQTAGTATAVDTAGNALATLPVGRTPAALAAAATGAYIYVTDNGTGELVTVRTMPERSGDLGARTGAAPVDVAVSPDGKCVLTADSGATTVSVLSTDTASGTPVELGEGNSPWGVAIAPDGSRACATTPETDRLFILPKGADGVCGAVGRPEVVDLGAGSAPHGVAVTPDSRYALTADAGTGTVSLVGLGAPETIARTVTKAQNPSGLAVSGDETHLFVSDYAGGGSQSHVSVLRRDAPAEPWSHSSDISHPELSGPHELAFTDAGAKGPCLYVTGYRSNNLLVFRWNPASEKWEAECVVGSAAETGAEKFDGPFGLALAPRRGLLFVANQGPAKKENSISVFAVRPDEHHRPGLNPKFYGAIPLPGAAAHMGLGISADERYLYATAYDVDGGTGTKKIHAMRLKEKIDEFTEQYCEKTVDITHGTLTSPSGVSCSADGGELYVANRGIAVQQADGTTVYEGGGVYVLSLDTDRLTLKGAPYALLTDTAGLSYSVATAAEHVYAGHFLSGTVSVLEPPVRHIPCGDPANSRPWDVTCTPDGSYAYITDRVSRRVHVLDLPGRKLLTEHSPRTDGEPLRVVCAPSGVRGYVTESGAGTVAVLQRTATRRTGWTAALAEAARGVALHPGLPLLHVAYASRLHPVRTDREAGGTDLSVGTDLCGVAVHPEGTHGYLADGTGDGGTTASLRVVDLATPDSPTDTGKSRDLPAGVTPTALATHRTGDDTVLYVAGRTTTRGGVWVCSVGGDPTSLTLGAALDDLGRALGLAVRAVAGRAHLYLITEERDGCRLHVLDLGSPTRPAPTGTTVALPTGVRDLTIHPRGWYGYATTASGGVLVLDLSDPLRPRQAGPPVTVGSGAAGGAALEQDGRAYLAHGTAVTDAELGPPAVVDRYPLTGDPQAVGVSGNGAHLFVTTVEAPGQLTVLDAWTGAGRGRVEAGAGLAGMATAPDGRHLYVADSTRAAVSVVDTAMDIKIGTTAVGLDPRQVICTG